MRASYCNALCQTEAWVTHHCRECRRLVDSITRRDGDKEEWVPRPFRGARHTIAATNALTRLPVLRYDHYLMLVEAFARPGTWNREQAYTCACPPAVIAVACALLGTSSGRAAPKVRQLVKAAMAHFFDMTRQQLNMHTPYAWADIHDPTQLMSWAREPADNSRARVDGVSHTVEGVDEWVSVLGRIDGARESSSLIDVELTTCECCTLYTSLTPIVDGRACLLHEQQAAAALFPAADVRRLDLLTRETALDLFTATELLRYTTLDPVGCVDAAAADDEPAVCHCRRSVCANDLTSHVGRSLGVACVRVTLTTGIIDVVALVLRNPELEAHCPSRLSLRSSYLKRRSVLS